MNPAESNPAVHPPQNLAPALMRGLCEKIDHDLSELAWLLAGHPTALPPGSIENILKVTTTIHEIQRQLPNP